MPSWCLLIARLSLAAWIGVASLFVTAGVREVRNVEQEVADRLVVIRFPAYYAYGFGLLLVGSVAVVGSGTLVRQPRLVRGLLAVTLLLMLVDRHWIYEPLVQEVTPPGQPRSAEFDGLHRASIIVNAIALTLAAVAAALVCGDRPGEGIRLGKAIDDY